MKQRQVWLLALLSILALVTSASSVFAEEAHLSGSWELGMGVTNVDDNPARANEYSTYRSEDGATLAPSVNLEFENGGFLLELESETKGPRSQMHELGIDAGRVFKLDSELSVLEHRMDHDTLSHIGATMVGDLKAGQPTIFTDATVPSGYDAAEAYHDTRLYDPTADSQETYDQELDNNYIITRREWKNEAELTIPQLPNVTIHAGMRIEERDGLKQAIGMSKCDTCHVSAQAKNINERTEDFTLGATGKFGLLTVEYEYLNRNFNEDANAPTRLYDGATTTNSSNYLLYGESTATELEYNKTPDSEKESHMVKARLDLPKNTSITASYVKADIDSSKTSDGSFILGNDTLSTEFESYGAKIATKIGKQISLSLRGSSYEIDAKDNSIQYPERNDVLGTYTLPFDSDTDEWVSAEEREVTEFGCDLVYRLARATTLRLGYEYEDIEREEDELGETETNSLTAAIKTRINNSLSARFSYKFQDIDDPFGADHATGIYQVDGDYIDGSGLAYSDITDAAAGLGDYSYWNVVYPERDLSATNQPDEVHEAKLTTTWAPSANMAATLFARVRYEENDEVEYEQTTYVPGVSFWYAPSDKLNLTMSYTFNNQDTENRACVGWYHG